MDLRRDVQKVVTAVHRQVFDLTQGRLGGRVSGMPVLKLTTTGRTSGQPRDTMLSSPLHDDRRVVLIASNGGAPSHPSWYRNLEKDPHVTVTMEGRTRKMIARTASGAEKAELWPQIVADHKNYAGYQTKTDRDIPVVILEPPA